MNAKHLHSILLEEKLKKDVKFCSRLCVGCSYALTNKSFMRVWMEGVSYSLSIKHFAHYSPHKKFLIH